MRRKWGKREFGRLLEDYCRLRDEKDYLKPLAEAESRIINRDLILKYGRGGRYWGYRKGVFDAKLWSVEHKLSDVRGDLVKFIAPLTTFDYQDCTGQWWTFANDQGVRVRGWKLKGNPDDRWGFNTNGQLAKKHLLQVEEELASVESWLIPGPLTVDDTFHTPR